MQPNDAPDNRAAAEDLRAEGHEFQALMRRLPPAYRDLPTAFREWTPFDVLRHLYLGDVLAVAAITDVEAFKPMIAETLASRASGASASEHARQHVGHLPYDELFGMYVAQLEKLCDLVSPLSPQHRLPWAAKPMTARVFAGARQMEVWAHAQAIYDLLGIDRPPAQDRLWNIADLCVRTFGWAFAIAGEPQPGPPPRVDLVAPSGKIWTWNEPSTAGRVEGDAVEFCQVLSQTRNVADTSLRMQGEDATWWVTYGQCFAGRRSLPPPPGSRRKSDTILPLDV
ncbi:maleylpyruvate isomerase family mycothiol-dependent enzyme [Ramlibacter sp.]|uniref:maleylpyruvate isomerase family mycothiol-dependent enzyme n=1 Tax=Ramlibacter sp. TaxID=1917967 RepID=UPI003D0C8C59